MRLKSLFLTAVLVFMGFYSNGQLADYLKVIEMEQMDLLKNGLLLIPLDKSNSQKENDRIIDSFEKFYTYSTVGYYTSDNSSTIMDSLPTVYFQADQKEVDLNLNEEKVFVLRIYKSRFNLREQYKLVRKRDEPVIDEIEYRSPKNDFEREQKKYSPSNTDYGGLFLEKFLPVEKKITKNKRILFNRFYFSRFHEEIDAQINLERAVKHLQDQMEKREEQLKRG